MTRSGGVCIDDEGGDGLIALASARWTCGRRGRTWRPRLALPRRGCLPREELSTRGDERLGRPAKRTHGGTGEAGERRASNVPWRTTVRPQRASPARASNTTGHSPRRCNGHGRREAQERERPTWAVSTNRHVVWSDEKEWQQAVVCAARASVTEAANRNGEGRGARK